MKYRKTGAQGSFEAWGTGLHYRYNSELNILDIARLHKQRVLAELHFDNTLSKEAFCYLQSLEKANQINALILSNNKTTDLTRTLDNTKLPAILDSTARLSRHAFDLHMNNFSRFSGNFCTEFDLESLDIKTLSPAKNCAGFFIGEIKTIHGNSAAAKAHTLSALMCALSEQILHNLITIEFCHRFRGSAHNLLMASTHMASIGCILDKNFIPDKKVQTTRNEQESLSCG